MSVNLLSFDLEEYFHGPAFAHIPRTSWKSLRPRLRENMEKILSILEGQKATFFVLGWVAEEYPDLVREMHRQGHEIACHGHLHRSIWDQSPREFKEDVLSAKRKLEDLVGEEVIGYRAPTFSIIRKTLWALPLLQEAGFLYDSSIFPIRHDRYGIPDFPRQPFQILDGLWEIPLSTIKFWGINFPFGGGGYLRLYPYWLTRFCVRKLNRENLPFVFYQHPYELEDRKMIAKPKSVLLRLRRSLSLGRADKKLRRLIYEHKFIPIRHWLEAINEQPKGHTG